MYERSAASCLLLIAFLRFREYLVLCSLFDFVVFSFVADFAGVLICGRFPLLRALLRDKIHI